MVEKLFEIDARIDTSVFDAELRAMGGPRVNRMRADALTWLSYNLQDESEREIAGRYDRPKKFTTNATFVWRAKASDGERMYAGVYFRDWAPKGTPAGRYLHPTIKGVTRPHKGFERALIRAGFMRSDEYATPGRDAPMDAYGNVPGGTIKQMLSQLKAGTPDQWETNRSRKLKVRKGTGRAYLSGRRWFVADGATGMPRGIYYRSGQKDPVLVFHFHRRAPKYRAIYPFRQIMAQRTAKDARGVFERAWRKHMIGPRRAKGLQ